MTPNSSMQFSSITQQKLQKLFHSLKTNTHIKTLAHSSANSLVSNKQKMQDKKQQDKLEMQVQHMKHLENLLLCQTKKLKQQVNNRRKQRVIYSNIFKKYQKDIKKWQCQYKESLLDSMATNDAQNSLKEKIMKIKRRLQKEIKELETIKHERERQIRTGSDNDKGDNTRSRHSTKNIAAHQSFKKLMTQRQLELKAKSLEYEYEKQSRRIMFEALSQQVLKIAGTDNLHEAIELIKNIDAKTEDIYDQYDALEKQNKEKEQKCVELEQGLREKSGTQSTISTEKEIGQIRSVNEQIEEEERRMRQLEEELSVKLDINCRKLHTDQLVSFIERMMLTRNNEQIQEELSHRDENSGREKSSLKAENILSGREGPKIQRRSRNALQKRLESVEKEKEINDYLLTKREINKFMLEQMSNKC